MKLMIAEDNEILRSELCMELEARGFHIVNSVSSGKEAVSLYDDSIDAVLMDIEMEEAMSGVKAAESIISSHPEALIIYLTSHDNDSVIISAMATGARDFIVKGTDADSIASRIKDAVLGRTQLDSRVNTILMGEYRRLRHSEKSLLYFIQHLSSLTPAEKELVSCLLSGMKVKEIAEHRFVEAATIKSQIRTLLAKTGCRRTKELISLINSLGLEKLF